MTQTMPPPGKGFFDKPPLLLAQALLGKVLRHRIDGDIWLSARIIETEAYEKTEKGSHASLGFTQKRAALFMPPGTIYMYYARGNDSLNFSAKGEGNGVLIKSAFPYVDRMNSEQAVSIMQTLNPGNNGVRPPHKLCNGQTLLCRSLDLKVVDWNQKTLQTGRLILDDVGYQPERIIQCARLGIPAGRDEHLPYRFIDHKDAPRCTSNPLTKRQWREDVDYRILVP